MSAGRNGNEWHVPCLDVAGRSRTVRVVVDESVVVLMAPPGESARLDWTQTSELSRLLYTLSVQALAGERHA